MELASNSSRGLILKILKMPLTTRRRQSILKVFPILHIMLSTFVPLQRYSCYPSLIIGYKLTLHRLPMITASPLSWIIHLEWEVEPHTFMTSAFFILRQGTSSSRSSLVQILLARPSYPIASLIVWDGLDNSSQCNQVDWRARYNNRRCHYRFGQVRLGQVWEIP